MLPDSGNVFHVDGPSCTQNRFLGAGNFGDPAMPRGLKRKCQSTSPTEAAWASSSADWLQPVRNGSNHVPKSLSNQKPDRTSSAHGVIQADETPFMSIKSTLLYFTTFKSTRQ